MQSKLILSITDAQIKYNNLPVFKNLNINLHKQSRIALVGKNGCGKTPLLKVISGVLELEEGERWIENGIKINSQLLKLPPGKSLKGRSREEFEIVRIKTDVLKSELIMK